MTWSDLLRETIAASGETTYAIAKRSGVPVQTIDRIMHGQEPLLATAEKLSAVLGLQLRRVRRKSR